MPADAIIRLYEKLVYWIADNAPRDWRMVEINMELASTEANPEGKLKICCFTGEDLVKTEFLTPATNQNEMRRIFMKLNKLAEETNDRWTGCNFAVLSSGNYDVEYLYDAPSRTENKLVAGVGA